MTRQDWQHLQQRMLGTSASTHNHHGWSALAFIAVTLGAALVMGLAIIAVIRRPPRRPPAAASSP